LTVDGVGDVSLPYPDPELHGSSFALRPFRAGDFEEARALNRDQATALWVPPLPADEPTEVVETYERYRAEGELLHLVVADTDSDLYLGEVMVVMCDHRLGEFGCGLASQARGRGIGTEALSLFVTWSAAALDLRRLQVLVATENIAALRLAERVGFRQEGVLRSYWDHGGEPIDAVMLSMLPGEVARPAGDPGADGP
jgi:RimJ/RimL family protein N-acetyltransferase